MSSIHSDTIRYLMGIPKYGKGTGLHRMEALCAPVLASDWAKQVCMINVVGSNGKGSVSQLLHAMQNALGSESNGLYTSPHLFHFGERMRLRGEPIGEADLAQHTATFRQTAEAYSQQYPHDTIGAFEAFTTVALAYFAEANAQNLILEAGIGGRFDPTRILTGKVVALTSLDLEHTQLLGDTLEKIAQDKLDIAQAGASVVVGRVPILPEVKSYADKKGLEILSISERVENLAVEHKPQGAELSFTLEGITFDRMQTPFQAEYAIDNLLVAVQTLLAWRRRYAKPYSDAAIVAAVRDAVQQANLLGRFQQVQTNPPLYLDLAHTPRSIPYVAEAIQRVQRGPLILVTGVSYDKEVDLIVGQLAPLADEVVCTRAYHKGSDPNRIARLVPSGIPKHIAPTIEQAVQIAQARAAELKGTILIAGGLFLSIEALAHLQGQNPQHLEFF